VGKILRLIIRSQWDRAVALFAAVVAAIALLLGWLGVATTSFPAEQVPYVVSGGIGGVLLMALAATLWISADVRDEWRKLNELSSKLDGVQSSLERLTSTHEGAAYTNGSAGTANESSDAADELALAGNHAEPRRKSRSDGRRGSGAR
jgi:hypothetical protein